MSKQEKQPQRIFQLPNPDKIRLIESLTGVDTRELEHVTRQSIDQQLGLAYRGSLPGFGEGYRKKAKEFIPPLLATVNDNLNPAQARTLWNDIQYASSLLSAGVIINLNCNSIYRWQELIEDGQLFQQVDQATPILQAETNEQTHGLLVTPDPRKPANWQEAETALAERIIDKAAYQSEFRRKDDFPFDLVRDLLPPNSYTPEELEQLLKIGTVITFYNKAANNPNPGALGQDDYQKYQYIQKALAHAAEEYARQELQRQAKTRNRRQQIVAWVIETAGFDDYDNVYIPNKLSVALDWLLTRTQFIDSDNPASLVELTSNLIDSIGRGFAYQKPRELIALLEGKVKKPRVLLTPIQSRTLEHIINQYTPLKSI